MQHEQKAPEKISRSEAFVNYVINCINDENKSGIVAAFRRADNPAMEYQCWEYLAKFSVDLTKSWERLPYATIAAAIAKAKIQHNGNSNLGRVLFEVYKGENSQDQAKTRLRRLIACQSTEEICRILRPLLSLIYGKNKSHELNYALLLSQLCQFHSQRQRIKAAWALSFYSQENS